MPDDEELEDLRRRRLEELRRQQSESSGGDPQQAAAEAQRADQERALREHLMRQLLAPEARERLERLRLARPDQAKQLENQLISLAQSGRLNEQLTDAQLRDLLARITDDKRDISIRRK